MFLKISQLCLYGLHLNNLVQKVTKFSIAESINLVIVIVLLDG